ncbi:MAG: tetratricopeptide repeat protein [Raineya sp.]|nr:tetratricopeptide repeat protein [Raineya sp.]MDW8295892.1 tetratricopeptide repeat protein [Raineya sp.]
MRYILLIILGSFASWAWGQSSINELIAQLNQAKDDEVKIQISKKIALAYQKQKGYGKAIEYYQRALDLEKANKKPLHQQGETQKDIAFAYLMMQDYAKAKENYKKVLEIEKADNNKTEITETLEALASICTENKEYKEAITYYQELLGYYKENLPALANTYNNIGYNYKKLGDTKKAIENFDQSIKINQQIANQNKGNTSIRAVALMNIGSTYSNEGDFKAAKKYYEDALIIRRSQNDRVEEAKIHNFLAVNDFLANRNENALDYVDKAISIAERELGGANSLKAKEVLMSSYQIKASIYQQQQDLKEYQKNYQKYLDLQKEYQEEEARQRQEMIEKQLELEKKESEIKSNIALEEKREMELIQANLEKEKAKKEAELRESEIQRLKADRELQAQRLRNAAIEKQRAEQQLELLRQKAEAERQQQQIAALEKDKEIERQKREAERKEAERKREILEKEKQLADLRAKEEKQKNFYTLIVLAVVGAFLVFVGYLLVLNQRKNKKLAAQNALIEEQNKELQVQAEELQQQQEEIMAQRDAIAQQNEMLAEQNEKIEKSINAAKTIQTAILPHSEKLANLFKDYFILFMPRDVVSGDFYWIEQIDENKTVVAAVDCTGHGVPGAFMSLIGNRLLEKVVILNKIHEPAQILESLHQEVRQLLRQQETGNRDGMDMALCVLEKLPDSKTKIHFAGAKRPLYYTEGENTQIFTLKGTRKSIGGEQNENVKFETTTITLPPNSCVYLCSDGITDQNDAERVKLGESKLKYTLSNVATQSMTEQHKAVQNLLENQLRGTLQRDDILLIGIKV